MNDMKHLDDQLADFTDRVLQGENTAAPDALQPEAQVVRQLNKMIISSDEPTAAFQQKLTRTLEHEWYAKRQKAKRWGHLRIVRTRTQQIAAVAVLAFFLLTAVALLFPEAGITGGELVGTANGDASSFTDILIAAGSVIGFTGIILWIWRNRK